MMASIIIGLLVLFGALLIGKILREVYPHPLFGAARKSGTKDGPDKA
ncbi:MAG: hypothetical protein ACE369_20330 [Roseovarius sp.]